MSRITTALKTEAKTAQQDVHTAARAFAESLAESAEFQAFERAADRLSKDKIAQEAIKAFQVKQQSLQMMLRLNAVSREDQAELERLQKAFMDHPSVIDYMSTQEALGVLCQAAANLLSERIGLSYSAACGPGCC